MQNVEDVADQCQLLKPIAYESAAFLSSFPPDFPHFGDGSSELLGPDNDFDAAIDLLLLDGSRRGCDESRFAEASGGDSVGRDIHHRDEPGFHSVRPAAAEIEIVFVGAEGIAYGPR